MKPRAAVCVTLLAEPSTTEAEGRVASFTGVAYSGDVVPNYGWRGDLAIDLASIQLPAGDVPVLLNHDPNKIVGRARLSNDGKSLTVADGRLSAVTESGKEVAGLFGEGHPWKLSIAVNGKASQQDRAKPVKLNGRSLVVDSVMRNARLIEFSFVPSGADPSAYAAALSARLGLHQPSGDPDMELAEALTRIAELEAAATAHAATLAAVTSERDTARTELATLATARRNERLTALFGAEHGLTDAQLAEYRSMTDAQFAVVESALSASRQAGDPELFRQTAAAGRPADGGAAVPTFTAAQGYGVDPERAALHAKALQYQAAHPGTDYLAAVTAVAV